MLSTNHFQKIVDPGSTGTMTVCGPTKSRPLLNTGWAAKHQKHEPASERGTRNGCVSPTAASCYRLARVVGGVQSGPHVAVSTGARVGFRQTTAGLGDPQRL